MSKKSNGASAPSLFAFIAVIFSAVAWLLDAILGFFGLNGGIITMILNTVAKVLLFVIALLFSYDYARRSKPWVKVIYWISVVIVIACIILGLGIF